MKCWRLKFSRIIFGSEAATPWSFTRFAILASCLVTEKDRVQRPSAKFQDDPLGELLEGLHSSGTGSLDFSINPKLRRLLFQSLREKTLPSPKGIGLPVPRIMAEKRTKQNMSVPEFVHETTGHTI